MLASGKQRSINVSELIADTSSAAVSAVFRLYLKFRNNEEKITNYLK